MIHVATNDEAILNDIAIDEYVIIKSSVQISDLMSVELIDTESGMFNITGLNDAKQRVVDTDYTQWLFRVTPTAEGAHQLLMKCSVVEFDSRTDQYISRNLSLTQTVTVGTEGAEPNDAPTLEFKPNEEKVPLRRRSKK